MSLIPAAIDSYTNSFSFDQMDKMNQSLFTLGYIEYAVLKTPKKVIINELVELAKRYGDDTSPKLLNGIMPKVIDDLTPSESDKKTTETKTTTSVDT